MDGEIANVWGFGPITGHVYGAGFLVDGFVGDASVVAVTRAGDGDFTVTVEATPAPGDTVQGWYDLFTSC